MFSLSLRLPFSFPIEAYWLSFVFVSIPILIEVFFAESNSKLRFVYILLFSLLLHLQYAAVDFSPYLSSSDALADYRLTDAIISDSRWFTEGQSPLAFEYGFYPLTNFIYLTFSLLTGIPLMLVVKFLVIIKAFVVTPIVYKLFKRFFDRRISYLATMIFLASPGAILFPHKETFAVIFFFIAVYVITHVKKTRTYLFLGLISFFSLLITHHFTMYVFLALLTSLFLWTKIGKRKKTLKISSHFFMLSWILFSAWISFISWAIILRHQSLIIRMFSQILLSGQLTFSELMPLYAPYEQIMIWLGYGLTLGFAGIGFICYMHTRNKKNHSNEFLAMAYPLIILLIGATILRFSGASSSVMVSHRAYEFGYILIGAMVAFFVIRVFPLRRNVGIKALMAILIVLIIIIGPMAGAIHPRTFTNVSRVVSSKAISLNEWLAEFSNDSESVIGDKLVGLIVSGYGERTVFENLQFFLEDTSLPFIQTSQSSNSNYFVTYTYMVDFYQIDLHKFDINPYLNNVYSNSVLNVYRICDRSLS